MRECSLVSGVAMFSVDNRIIDNCVYDLILARGDQYLYSAFFFEQTKHHTSAKMRVARSVLSPHTSKFGNKADSKAAQAAAKLIDIYSAVKPIDICSAAKSIDIY